MIKFPINMPFSYVGWLCISLAAVNLFTSFRCFQNDNIIGAFGWLTAAVAWMGALNIASRVLR
jgi:hypothetical protein